jgi:hypothetical protein
MSIITQCPNWDAPFDEIDLGKGVPVETVEKMMESWTIG